MSLLKPTELDELKKLAGANLESALMAAARMGATRSGTAAAPIKRAASMLEYDAEMLLMIHGSKSHGKGGMWAGAPSEAKQDYEEKKRVAKALRDLLTSEEGK